MADRLLRHGRSGINGCGGVSRKDQQDALVGLQRGAKNGGEQMIFAIVEAAIFFLRQKTIAVPLLLRLDTGLRAQQIKGSGALKGSDLHAIFQRRDVHAPISSVRAGVKIAIVDESFYLQLDGRAAP